jgi:hypothetical protein
MKACTSQKSQSAVVEMPWDLDKNVGSLEDGLIVLGIEGSHNDSLNRIAQAL